MIDYALYFTDPHCGAKKGLMNPQTMLEDVGPDQIARPYQVTLCAYQNYTWNNIVAPAVEALSKLSQGRPVTTIFGGDAIQGNMGIQGLFSAKLADQDQIACDVFGHIFKKLNVEKSVFVGGTGFHVGIDGDAEYRIAALLSREFPNIDITASELARVEVGGSEITVAHHGPTVNEAHLRSNAAVLHLRRRMYEEITILDRKPSDAYLYGHRHCYAHVWHCEPVKGRDYTSHLVVCPALCPANGYAIQKTNSRFVQHLGLVWLKIEDGNITEVNRDFIFELDIRQIVGSVSKELDKGVVSYPQPGSPRPGLREKIKETMRRKKENASNP